MLESGSARVEPAGRPSIALGGDDPQMRGHRPIAKELRTNDQITVPEVRLIRDEEQLGIVPIAEAQRMADDAGLDLVEVAPTADPPVCRILDYGKFKYEQAKRDRESRRGSKNVQLREVRMRVKIDEHDIEFKARIARKLLNGGDKVKVSVMFRAREITHPEVGRDLLDRFFERLNDISTMERRPVMEGRFMSMIIEPGVRRERRPQRERRDSSASAAPPQDAPPQDAAPQDAAPQDAPPQDAQAADPPAAEPAAPTVAESS